MLTSVLNMAVTGKGGERRERRETGNEGKDRLVSVLLIPGRRSLRLLVARFLCVGDEECPLVRRAGTRDHYMTRLNRKPVAMIPPVRMAT